MYFITGHIFEYSGRQRSSGKGISMQERMAMSRHNPSNVSKTIQNPDTLLTLGCKYKIIHIKKIMVDDIQKVQYRFQNVNTNDPAIEMIFDSTTQGDDYIAGVSGVTEQLNNLRQQATLNDNDL